MKQIIQSFKTGETILEDVPRPLIRKGHVLIRTHRSLVSLGTEKMLVEFGRSSLIEKARQQPDRVKQVLDKIKSDGLIPTLEAVFTRLGEPLPLGYCNAGEVVEVGEGITDLKPGDRVASNGPHAEIVCVPRNLVTKIPDKVSYEEAAFTVIGSIGLQGIRLVNPTLGETVVVSGLGLIGLITCELLLANGCNVIGFDFDVQKVTLAQEKGVHAFNLADGTDPVKTVAGLTEGIGADAVIITASTKSDELISQAAQMSRKRGRIVLVGVIGLDIKRADFYEKELSFQVSCSYGPGRYDEEYEKRGVDYPLSFVRWTENRNFQTILQAIAKGQLDVKRLITEAVDLSEYQKIYNNIGDSRSIASILQYPNDPDWSTSIKIGQSTTDTKSKSGTGTIAIAGAGNFTKMTLLPALGKIKADIRHIVSASGVSGTHLAQKHAITQSTTRYEDVLSDPAVQSVIITTQHNLHASQTIQALQAGKHVFVEKPLVLTEEELQQVVAEKEKSSLSVMVGFNRRFAPLSQKAKKLLGNTSEPVNIVITVNAGFIPANHWTQNMAIGGGRIIGEGCHFIDLVQFFSSSQITEVFASALGTSPSQNTDNTSITLKCHNGSQGVVNYFANGHKSYSKERIEIYSQGRVLILDNFRKLEGYGFKGFSSASGKQDKGHAVQFEQYIRFLKEGGVQPIDFQEIVNSTQATFAALKSLQRGEKQIIL
ncbi:bi-domain-containing oxidoreductase [Cytophagaceae bacterium YF14B1]|uniref:Bi-domain-containing oxidoreductase n=1 Tax=Xanthocytophaga flava TaxID=3048013 RepID=A0AAE3U9D0_9BACT|nr:bi-domain-containing oxidoreductase [Xanthocytophaga flavus]MDJ1484964.1 bi-domain-containing oxidoreductase [Xanthocytophaga flavus]